MHPSAAPHAFADAPATADWPVDDEALLLSMPWLLRGRGASDLMHAVVAELAAGDPQRLRQALPVLRAQGLDLRLHRTPLLAIPDAWLPAVLLLRSGDTCVLTARGHDAEGQPRCTVVLQGPEGDDQFTTSTAELATEYSGQALVLHLLSASAPAAAPALPKVVPLRGAAPRLVVADDAGPLPSLDELVGQRDLADDLVDELVDDPVALDAPEPAVVLAPLLSVEPPALAPPPDRPQAAPAWAPRPQAAATLPARPWPAADAAVAATAAANANANANANDLAPDPAIADADIRFSRPEPLTEVARRVAAQALPRLQALQRAATDLGSGLRERAARVGQAARGAVAIQRARLAMLSTPVATPQAAPGEVPLLALRPPAPLAAPLPEVAQVLQRVTPLLLQDVVVLPPTLLRQLAPVATATVLAPVALSAWPASAAVPEPGPAASAQRPRRPLRPQVARTPQRAQLPSSLRPQRQLGRAVGEIHRLGSSLAASVR